MNITDKNAKEIFIYEKESTFLDFKMEYIINKKNSNNIVKDIMSFANCHEEGDKNIVIGIKEIIGKNDNLIHGNNEKIDISNIENLIHSNIEPEIKIELKEFNIDEKNISVIIIKRENYKHRPFLMKKKTDKYFEGQGFIRKGASNRSFVRDDFIRIQKTDKYNGEITLHLFDENKNDYNIELEENKNELEKLIVKFNTYMKKLNGIKKQQIHEKEAKSSEVENSIYNSILGSLNEQNKNPLDMFQSDYEISDERIIKLERMIPRNSIPNMRIPLLKCKKEFGGGPLGTELYISEIFSHYSEAEEAYDIFKNIEYLIGEIEVESYFNGKEAKLFYLTTTNNATNIEIHINNFKISYSIDNIEQIIEKIESEMMKIVKVLNIKTFKEEVDIVKDQRRRELNKLPTYYNNFEGEKNFDDLVYCFEPFDNTEYDYEQELLTLKISKMNKNEKIFLPYYLFINEKMEFHISSSFGESTGLLNNIN